MKKMKELNTSNILLLIIPISLILMHDNIIYLIANINSSLKRNNEIELLKSTYEYKIEDLTHQILDYESSLNNLNIYEDKILILSKVALRNVYDFYDSMTINSDEKVSKNAFVVNEKGLVGIVTSTSGYTSNVRLLSSSPPISVKVSNTSGVIGPYDKKTKTILIKNINDVENIEVGDEVLTTSFIDQIENIKVGRVTKIEKKGIEKRVYFSPYVDFEDLNYLYCIKK